MFARQRREIVELAARTRLAEARAERAGARVERAARRFVARPFNLWLPFAAGLLGGALALHRTPAAERARATGPDKVSWRSLLGTAGALWSASTTLREALQARMIEPPEAPAEPPAPGSGLPPPHAADRGLDGASAGAAPGGRRRASSPDPESGPAAQPRR